MRVNATISIQGPIQRTGDDADVLSYVLPRVYLPGTKCVESLSN